MVLQFILLIIIIIITIIIIIILIIIIIILIIIIINTSAPISNLFYIDDLKLFSKNEQEARTSWRTENSETIQ